MASKLPPVDIVVVGMGWSGVAAAEACAADLAQAALAARTPMD